LAIRIFKPDRFTSNVSILSLRYADVASRDEIVSPPAAGARHLQCGDHARGNVAAAVQARTVKRNDLSGCIEYRDGGMTKSNQE